MNESKTDNENFAKKPSWYFSNTAMVAAFLFVGPFMLPLVWLHPAMSRKRKIIYSAVVLAGTIFLSTILVKSALRIMAYYKELGLL